MLLCNSFSSGLRVLRTFNKKALHLGSCPVRVKTVQHLFFSRFQLRPISYSPALHGLSSENQKGLCRINFHHECEDALNRQINQELYNSYFYQSMAFFFSRNDVALPGFHNFFKTSSREELQHAEKLMEYMNRRGGIIKLNDIQKPNQVEWESGIHAMEAAMKLERETFQLILDLHTLAGNHNDPSLTGFLDTHFIPEQEKEMKEIADHITNLYRVGPGLGKYKFDKSLASRYISDAQSK